jgi:hypothetical protein
MPRVVALSSLTAGLVALVVGAAPAAAKPKPIKAELLCGTFADNEVKQPLTGAGKTGKISDMVVCAMHMSNPKEPAHMGMIKTIRHPVDPATGKRQTVDGTSFTTDFGPGSDNSDVELRMLNGEPMDDHSIAFKPCEDFDIVGTISDDLGVYYTKTIKVVQGCPKPPKFKATVACEFIDKAVKHTKITKRDHERPNDLDMVSCTLASRDDRLGEEATTLDIRAQWTQYNDDGTTEPKQASGNGDRQVMQTGFTGMYSISAEGWPNCQDVDLFLSVTTGDGTVVYTEKVPTTVTCGE